MAPFGSANGSPPHGAASTNSRIKCGRQVPDVEFIAGVLGNVGPEITYSKTPRRLTWVIVRCISKALRCHPDEYSDFNFVAFYLCPPHYPGVLAY
jgi:hypothetical protein